MIGVDIRDGSVVALAVGSDGAVSARAAAETRGAGPE